MREPEMVSSQHTVCNGLLKGLYSAIECCVALERWADIVQLLPLPVRHEVAWIADVQKDTSLCSATSTLPERASTVTLGCEASGTM